jgi:hypothetical protein
MLLQDKTTYSQIEVLYPRESNYLKLQQTMDTFTREQSLQSGSKRTLGYKHTEYIIPVGISLNVYGEIGLTENEGKLCIKKSRSKPWVLTTKTKDQIVRDSRRHQTYFP